MKKQHKVVLVTRPQQQASEFTGLLTSRGINSISFPCIEIQSVKLNQQLNEALSHLNKFDIIIFISANAVEHAARLMQLQNILPTSISGKVATIGKATLVAAKASGFKVDLSPDNGFNSDSLLALNEFQAENIKQARCLIFRGIGGLEYLADELCKRGAFVQYAEVYKRIKPVQDKNISRQQLSDKWSELHIGAITVTSNESLQNLYDMLEGSGKHDMLDTPLIVASQRGFKLAQSLGFKSVKVSLSAMNQHMLQTVENEFE